ncbi:MAG TPA: gamma-glutamyltransferase, partial [Bacilli bacterium]|nr:gamma-glutamyltransferase [Bacilli bacterium]
TVSFEPVDYDEHYSTTTFSVVDKEGNIVSVTQTINYFFGNGLVVPGFGFFMNNQLSGFSFTSSSASYIQPYKQPVSHIMPTIVMKDGNPYATLGSPGSMRIPAAVLQVLINMIDFGMNIQEAIEYPRIYCYAVGSDETYTNKKDLYLEQAFDDDVRDGLRALGYNLIFQGSGDIDLYFGGVQGVRFIDGNKMHGGADPRRDGKALGY